MSISECPPIKRLAEEREQAELLIKQKAGALYATFSKSERTLVRFGMFPADKMKQLDDELLAMRAEGLFPMFDRFANMLDRRLIIHADLHSGRRGT